MNQSYTFSLHTTILSHANEFPLLLGDHDNHPDPHKAELDALVASGDYFITLATTLDQINEEVAATNETGHGALEKLISDLAYLQQKYKISKK